MKKILYSIGIIADLYAIYQLTQDKNMINLMSANGGIIILIVGTAIIIGTFLYDTFKATTSKIDSLHQTTTSKIDSLHQTTTSNIDDLKKATKEELIAHIEEIHKWNVLIALRNKKAIEFLAERTGHIEELKTLQKQAVENSDLAAVELDKKFGG